MSSGRGHPVGEVQLRYRRTDGEFADTTLERVVVDDLVAGLPVREFRWSGADVIIRAGTGRQRWVGWWLMRAGWSWLGSCSPIMTGTLWRSLRSRFS